MILGPQSRATSSFTRCWRPGVKAKWCRQSHRRSQQRRRAVETFERAPAAPIATPQLEESQVGVPCELLPLASLPAEGTAPARGQLAVDGADARVAV